MRWWAAADNLGMKQRPTDPAQAHTLHEVARAHLAWQALCSVDAAVSIVDVRLPDQPMVYVNEAFCRLTGYDESELLGRNCRLLQHADVDPVALDTLRRAIAAGQSVGAVLRNRRRDGSTFWNALHVVPLLGDDGQVTHYAGFQRDVAESSLTAHAVLSMDEFGPAEARGRFDRAVADALRQQAAGRQRHVLIVLCGADFPAALPLQQRVAVASQLQPFMAPTAALCFLGRGATALLIPVRDDETPGWVAEKVQDMVQASWACGVGLAEPFVDGDDGQTLLAAARAAAERAARAGVPGPCHADPTRDARDRRARLLLRDSTTALQAGQFRAVYQPQVNLQSGEMTGLEALLRWRHPTLGEVSPGEFIGHLERLPQICDITHWMLDGSLRHIARWSRLLGRALRLSVNVPAEVLLHDAFVLFALSALYRHGVAPGQLEIELTERSLTSADGPAVTRLHELRDHGVLVAIDDFGTGWSSLAYLARLPVDTLKVDLQFTRGVLHNRADAAISRMTVELARGLGLRCVAEGIETPEQLRFFAELGCDEGQGYLLSRPLEIDAVDRLITDQLTDPVTDQTGLLPAPPPTNRRPTRTLATRTACTEEDALLPCPR